MTFEQWMRRPVYIVQVFTAMTGMTLFGWHRLRFCRPYKHTDPTSRCVRKQTADIIRQYRREGLTRQEVRRKALERIANSRGIAVRVDIDEELKTLRAIREEVAT